MLNVLRTKEIKQKIQTDPNNVLKIIEDVKDLGICITDPKGYLVAVNSRYLEIYGYRREELIGNHFTMIVPDANRKKLSTMHDRFIENEYEILRNWEVTRKDGSKIKIQADAGFFNNILEKKGYKVTFVYYNE